MNDLFVDDEHDHSTDDDVLEIDDDEFVWIGDADGPAQPLKPISIAIIGVLCGLLALAAAVGLAS